MEHHENSETTAESHAPAPSLERIVAATEKYAREEPVRAISAAFGSGLILTLLPIGTIVSGVLRLAFALVRPLLIILGVVKLYERLGETSNDQQSPNNKPENNLSNTSNTANQD